MEILNTQTDITVFPTHIGLLLAQCGTLAGFIKTMRAEEMQDYKKYINIL